MKNYSYQNILISKKQLRQLLAWSFTNYNAMQSCSLADELKYLGFHYASHAGISISIEDLKIPFIKTLLIDQANQEITNAEKLYLKGRITNVERYQKIIDTWGLTSESLKEQIIYYFKTYDPLNSVYIMAFSGARGNLSQVRQLVGMRGLMSDPSGEIMNLPIKKNFREGLTITDYLMSGYGARKGIVDTALKTANSGYLTRRLIDVSQDILIREKNCGVDHSISRLIPGKENLEMLIGLVLKNPVQDPQTKTIIAKSGTQITFELINLFKEKKIKKLHLRSPLACTLYRAICQECYGWDLSTENIVDVGAAVGIIAGQSIGEPGTQLTMRTFHTGGIFTAAVRQQIRSPRNGIIQFYNQLKTSVLRTNRGEEVVVTKNSGFILLIPENDTVELIKIEVLPNTILFPKNNQYVLKDAVIGELINTNQQSRLERKSIISHGDGEVFIPKLKERVNVVNNNKFLWILVGKVYHSPKSAFLNLQVDHKVNQSSYISRAKFVAQYNGVIHLFNRKPTLYQRLLKTSNVEYSCTKMQVRALNPGVKLKTHLLQLPTSNYFVEVERTNSHSYLKHTSQGKFGTLITNKFKTLIGGKLFYDSTDLVKASWKAQFISFLQSTLELTEYQSLIHHTTIVWLEEEIYSVDCKPSELLVEQEDFVPAGFKMMPDTFSKTSGVITLIRPKPELIESIQLKTGVIYEGRELKKVTQKIYYPGERLFLNVITKTLVFCDNNLGKNSDKLLARPVKLYEIPRLENLDIRFENSQNTSSNFEWQSGKIYSYKSGQIIRANQPVILIFEPLFLNTSSSKKDSLNLELWSNSNNKNIGFKRKQTFQLTNYVVPYLKYKSLQSCLLVQKNQFLSKYTILGYVENVTIREIEIIRLKIKEFEMEMKQILVVSNSDCIKVNKQQLPNKKVDDLVTTGINVSDTGKIILANEKNFVIQKGQPYFFPNCKTTDYTAKPTLQYKIIAISRLQPLINVSQNLSLTYVDISKISSTRHLFREEIFSQEINTDINTKIEFSKFFIKKNRKLYTCLIPQFLQKFHLNTCSSKSNFENFISPIRFKYANKLNRTILIRESSLAKKSASLPDYQLRLLDFIEQPFSKSTKAVGLGSITEGYFEQEVNNIFCKNREFIEAGKTVGLLNLEKAITGDIVQGLPRVEEILEARKKNLGSKTLPKNQKKGLLTQINTLDPNFDFKKLGLPIVEKDRINPHKFLKVYFNYYGLTKSFSCNRKNKIVFGQLFDNYKGSLKSLKKVQLFILHSVQAIYYSQGVAIHDKHLEVIIKQMTTKILVTFEGSTPLLRREVVDLYHIKLINKTMDSQFKENACYVPLLLGITKAALNNPSFLSAASFQETTRVLTKAGIEGRIDWLRGLKENIIIGHLIPAGTGRRNYQDGFQNSRVRLTTFTNPLKNSKRRQVN
jgi:DNA-directed RNA polymerase subunit beta'